MLSLPGAAACAAGTRETKLRDHRTQGHQRRSVQRVGQELPTVQHDWFSVMDEGRRLCQLVFRHRQDGVDGLAHAAREGGAGRDCPRP